MGSFLKLKSILEERERFILVCHVEPDGDAIGSMLALGKVLENNGKKVIKVCKDPIPSVFEFLSERDEIYDFFPNVIQNDAIILLDNGDLRRTGLQEEILRAKKIRVPIVNIDHHVRNDLWKIVDINYADESVSSASELVYKIMVGLNYEFDVEIATLLLAGIFNDTGGFKHQNTTTAVLEIVSDLLKRGAKLKRIVANMENSHPVSMFRLWGIALDRLRINEKYGASVSVLKAEDLEKVGASEDDISGLVNLLNSTPESKVSLLLYETKDAKIKGSFRTERDDIDTSAIARLLGGGGHKKASGFTIEGRIEIDGNNWKIV